MACAGPLTFAARGAPWVGGGRDVSTPRAASTSPSCAAAACSAASRRRTRPLVPERSEGLSSASLAQPLRERPDPPAAEARGADGVDAADASERAARADAEHATYAASLAGGAWSWSSRAGGVATRMDARATRAVCRWHRRSALDAGVPTRVRERRPLLNQGDKMSGTPPVQAGDAAPRTPDAARAFCNRRRTGAVFSAVHACARTGRCCDPATAATGGTGRRTLRPPTTRRAGAAPATTGRAAGGARGRARQDPPRPGRGTPPAAPLLARALAPSPRSAPTRTTDHLPRTAAIRLRVRPSAAGQSPRDAPLGYGSKPAGCAAARRPSGRLRRSFAG